jgi:hypothetical protein
VGLVVNEVKRESTTIETISRVAAREEEGAVVSIVVLF